MSTMEQRFEQKMDGQNLLSNPILPCISVSPGISHLHLGPPYFAALRR